ncbi:universal stress protein [Rhizobium sp. NPDC090279]|uniref:universal stress protein n=1 Tax=Rhizobium sp. NPDC090279 TaxID=3364499 RepID=UPI00383BDD34
MTNAAITDVLDTRLRIWASLTGLIAAHGEELCRGEAFWENVMYDKIICAIGLGSRERAERLLFTSRSLLSTGGELTVAHIVERSPSGHENPDDWAVSVISEAEEKLNALCRRLGITASIDVRLGTASKTLLTVANERNADLIVLATHTSDILDRIFGSTVEYVIRHAECSVLVERADKALYHTTTKADGTKKA